MRIGDRDLQNDVLVVAEIGNNHEGDVDLAIRLVQLAAECGAGAIKLQTFRARDFVRPTDTAQYQRMARFELSAGAIERIHRVAKDLGLLFISTPLDLGSVDLLEPLVDCYKVASGDNDHLPLIERICRTGRPIVLSTGLADLADVRSVVSFIRERWRGRHIQQDLAVLHCVTSYPVPPEQANVAAIRAIADALEGVTVGYSDHTIGTDACVLAVALGARIIEKHFTIDKRYSDFRDHAISADPPELAELVRRIRQARTLLGTGDKVPQPAEVELTAAVRRSIVAAGDLPAGHVLRLSDLTWMRPADGLRPGEESRLVGRSLTRPIAFGETIRPTDVA